MKTYFNFSLTGKQFFSIWLLLLILFFVPYVWLIAAFKDIQPGDTPPLVLFPTLFVLCVVAFIFTFYITKLIIENIQYKEENLRFEGEFGKFARTVLWGILLTIITLGIYGPWFIRKIQCFFVNNSSYKEDKFSFEGKGGKLLVILLLTLFLPMIIIQSITVGLMAMSGGFVLLTGLFSGIIQVVTSFIMIPYMYYVYKWMVNINYKDYNIRWETNFWSSVGKIALETLLCMITLGIYFPIAMLELYHYFAGKTFAVSENGTKRFGYENKPSKEFWFIWGQTLLTIITLGIYYPWAFCKISQRIFNKTYLESL